MALTALMFVVLIASFALMVALVKFTENVIGAPVLQPAPAADREVAAGNIDNT